MAIPLYQDLWNGKETLSETVALRCGEKQLTFGDFFQDILRAKLDCALWELVPETWLR